MGELPAVTSRYQDRLREQLMRAIERDDCNRIASLVRSGAPLHKLYHHPEIVGRKVEPSVRDAALVNPVDWAALQLRLRPALLLLELGDERTGEGDPRPWPQELPRPSLASQTQVALVVAARYGHLGLLRGLLERGAPVAQQDHEGVSALRAAVAAGHLEAASLLLQYEAWVSEERRDEVLRLAHLDPRGLATLFAEAHSKLTAAGKRASPPPPGAPTRAPTPSTRASTACGSPCSRSATPHAGAGRRVNPARELALPRGLVYEEEARRAAGAVGARRAGAAAWGWAPLHALPKTPLAAASGGATAAAGAAGAGAGDRAARGRRALPAADVRLRGELTAAIRKGDLLRLEALVARGAPLESAFDLGYGAQGNCIDWACVSARPEAALWLLAAADQAGLGDALAAEANAAFFWSTSEGYVDVLRELLRRGADVAQPNPAGAVACGACSALAAAVVGSQKEAMLELLRHGAWEAEPEASKELLLEHASRRRPAAEAFQEAGLGDFAAQLAPPVLPFKGHGIWGPDYPPPGAAPSAAEA